MTFLGSLNGEYQDASNTARRALLETSMMKKEIQEFQTSSEKNLYKYSGLKKDDLVYAFYAYPLVAGKVSTKPFTGLKYKMPDGWVLRPELEYSYRDQTSSALLILVREF